MRRRPVCILCLLLVVFLCVTDWLGFSMTSGNPLPEPVQTWIKKHPESTICGEVVRCQENEEFQSVYLKDTYLIYNSEKVSIDNVRVYLKENNRNKNSKKLLAGSLILVSGKLEEVPEPGNPGEFDSRQYYACRRIYYVMKKGKVEKQSRNHSAYGQFLIDMQQKFAGILEKACGNEAGAFEAIVLGDKSNLDAELKMRYQMAGIIHILAISGLHISLLGMGLYNILKKIGLGIWPAGLLSLVIMLQYGMMTGGTVSTMRAVCMFLLSVGAKIAGRIYDMPTGMAASAILILVENPAYLLDGGFLMSFGSVIGIGCVWPLIVEVMDREEKNQWKTEDKGVRVFLKSTGKSLWKSFLASGTVQLTTLPVVLWFYGEISVLGIFLNLLVLPTVGVVLGSGTAGALVGLFSGRGAFLTVVPGRIILKGYEFLAAVAGKLSFCTWAGGRPQVCQMVGYYVILAVSVWIYRWTAQSGVDNDSFLKCESDLYNRKDSGKEMQIIQNSGVYKSHKRQNRCKYAVMKVWGIRGLCAAAVCLGILLIGYKPREDFRIACLDVGQGDGIVIEIENQWNILIDGGSTNKSALGQYQLLPYLKSRGISRLDGIYISHTDEDHISGVRQILEYIGKGLTVLRVENLILPDWQNVQENKNYQELIKLAEAAGTRVLYAKAGDRIQYGQASLEVLWPLSGASGTEVNEDAMVMEMTSGDFKGIFTGDIGKETEEKLLQNGWLEDVDFLKVAHHGSKYSTGQEFLDIVKPELAVISCSSMNTYGHPSPDTLRRLENSGSKVLITKDAGAVMIYRKHKHIFAKTYRKNSDCE